MRVRFAPSPTGQLHVGNARTALFNWLLARGSGGTFVLRIEDTDVERSTPESERAILEDLRWLGLDWDEGVEKGGEHGPYRQSERLHVYRAHAVELLSRGQAYRCFCPPEQLEMDRYGALRQGLPPKYVGRCRTIPEREARARAERGEPAVIRFRVPEGRDVVFGDVVRGEVRFSSDVIGDPVLIRSDGTPAYNYAVVVDDALMGITHVIRGEDHLSNTPRQLLLYEAFGWPPPLFAHVSLVLGPDHGVLSKRHGATSVAEFRARGYLPEALANYLALLGWSPGDGEELLPIDELARRFRLEHVGRSAGVFDVEKLAWVNRHYLKLAAPERLARLAVPYLQREGWVGEPSDAGLAFLARAVPPAAGSVDRLEQLPDRLRFLFDYSATRALDDETIRAEAESARQVIGGLAEELTGSAPLLDRETFRAVVMRLRDRTGLKGRPLLHPIRLVLTGEAEGLELDAAVPAIELGALLGGEGGVRRIPSAAERAVTFRAALNG
ncbi:MAG: glutamate--tRNA ligase [Acidobacteria bacterium RIFCSPLOWO2_02_FULL_68_18]|nr:MAG: glutamate--tRNA ligase [Acidobacteria bacterium RIFCSPLOWO2_02_FULL_68_18]OFW50590.1 MAG: glutamate--tRNA ligase [Acidobacteria bacterium RIFCSPLOWO2_12_FULL_68_19]